jgi:hypothetical protein
VPDLHPEQAAALAYIESRGTRASAESIAQRFRRVLGEISELLAGLPPAVVHLPPPGGGWSLAEVVDHLVVTHELALAELGELIAGREPRGEPIPAALQSGTAHAVEWPALLARFGEVHRGLQELVEGADDATSLEPRATVVMVVKCAAADGTLVPVHWAQSFDWKAYATVFRLHLQEHVKQIRRTLAAVAPPPERIG